ncbi:hypothetical protein AMJ80_10540 [bacterium SM23_31]|nr:MAG: hypothetical protein AMJ80_10540 [bacterium SM23_31]
MQIGARPLGMGGAFSAIANDANAMFWNPAGVVTLQRQEISTMYSDLYGIGLANSYFGYVLPVSDNHALGIDWMHLGQADDELGYRQDNFNLAYSLRLPWNISIGTKAKIIDTDITLDGTSWGKSRGYGFDIGFMMRPTENLRLALVGQDIGGTSVTYDNDITEEVKPQKFRFGAAYSPLEGLLLAADLDDRIHAGAEYWIMGILALRGGVQKNLKIIDDYNPTIISAGFSTRYRFIQFDYAIESHPNLDITQRFGFSIYYNPSLVSIKDAVIKPVPLFRSLYRKYSEEEFAEIVLKNSSQERLPVRVRLDIPKVTIQPYEEEIILEPQTTRAYALNISLSNDILNARGSIYDSFEQPVLTVSYEQDKREKKSSRNLEKIYVLGKNKISWSIPERVAAFVTPEDGMVDRFARSIVQQYSEEITEKYNNSNLGKATVIFDALGKHGIVYQEDPQTAWYKIAADSSIFDNIQYPVELLDSKIGDCDDCTVLFASLLENLGIQTVLLDVFAPGEGHIYMMFDSGIPVNEIKAQPYDENEYAIYNNKVWIPVETTMYGHSFNDAWREGAAEYHFRKEQGYINEINIAEAKNIYKAGQPAAKDISIPEKSIVDELVTIDIETYDNRLEQFAMAAGVSMDNPDGVYDAGAFYLRFNRLDEALRLMLSALELRPDFSDALNALGVIYTRQGKYDEALQSYYRASELMPDNAGIRFNIAITLLLQGKLDEARNEYDNVIKMDKSFEGLLKILKKGGEG